jgi:hypothetical protein
MMFRCYSLENSVLDVMFTPVRLKNPRKRGSITIKRVRSNCASRIDETVVAVTSDKGECVIEIVKQITLLVMKAKVDSGEDKVIKLEQHSTSSEANSNPQEEKISEMGISESTVMAQPIISTLGDDVEGSTSGIGESHGNSNMHEVETGYGCQGSGMMVSMRHFGANMV